MGKTLWVNIVFAREIRGNIIISEKDAWAPPRPHHSGFTISALRSSAVSSCCCCCCCAHPFRFGELHNYVFVTLVPRKPINQSTKQSTKQGLPRM
ncbi:hypothetical protein M758_11G163700 [Ceratodon purpureus]|uniref:Uncharacterized protein n=1 Tax=Ceratodon purpureus TaxID=3225 RepID=A0A8T0GF92_CERPU|nr:hypothetical protein KC19_11G167900 [Ceratodon purpureus]KAG0602159.1 hypothetical protein M758_11G163700 [Ceratodon purpureus]